ncbi:MAG: TrkH family potassium uptake protein [Bacteroidota bacterium]
MIRSRLFRKIGRLIIQLQRVAKQAVWQRFLYTLRQVIIRGYAVSGALIPIFSLLVFGLMLYDLGFNQFSVVSATVSLMMYYLIVALALSVAARFLFEWWEPRKWWTHLYSFILVAGVFYLIHLMAVIQSAYSEGEDVFWRRIVLFSGIALIFLSEVSQILRFIYQRSLRPAFVFVASFFVMVLIGALLLMLPNATYLGISFVDAIFTSASAVCVTGLTVVDTATHFTPMGKVILLLLIQIGGLGFMTFTALLGYLAVGSMSFKNQMALKDMLQSNRMSNVVQLVTRIVVVTFFFEGVGVLAIWWNLPQGVMEANTDRLFFSVFHSVSAFCNAGFSTVTDGLYTSALRFNYGLQLSIAGLILLGGIGFPILFNIFAFLRSRLLGLWHKVLRSPTRPNYLRAISVSSKLALTTSIMLLLVGFCAYLIFEWENTLTSHATLWGKLVTSFFGSVTPRTAGFNTVSLAELSLPTTMIYLLLMWIGASPGSTGGGIKTTTFAVAVLNLASVVRGKNRTEIYRHEIGPQSIGKAFAIILLSLLIVGLSVFLMAVSDPNMGLLPIAFESFSAFSTVGLTLGITPLLSDGSKLVLVVVMFVGRVGAITILMALINQSQQLHYRYPTEEVIF